MSPKIFETRFAYLREEDLEAGFRLFEDALPKSAMTQLELDLKERIKDVIASDGKFINKPKSKIKSITTFSDGVDTCLPRIRQDGSIQYSKDDVQRVWLKTLGIESFPNNYELRRIKYVLGEYVIYENSLFGHRSHEAYKNPTEFIPHLNWLMKDDPYLLCNCAKCKCEQLDMSSCVKLMESNPDNKFMFKPKVAFRKEKKRQYEGSSIDDTSSKRALVNMEDILNDDLDVLDSKNEELASTSSKAKIKDLDFLSSDAALLEEAARLLKDD